MHSANDPSDSDQQPPAQRVNNHFSLQDDEDAQLAEFDRFIQSSPDQSAQLTTSSSTNPAPSASLPEPPSVLPPSKQHLDFLASAYPHYDRDTVSAVLVSCNNDVSSASRVLADSVPPSSASSDRRDSAHQTPPSSPPAPTSSVPTSPSVPSSPPPSQQTDSDAALASLLQRQERARAARHRRNEAPFALDPQVMQRLVAALREIVVPALRAHFGELVLPDSRDDSGTFIYELQSLQVAALSLPDDNVSVRPSPDAKSVLVNVVNANLELEVGRWSYEGSGFIPLSDSGRARVSAHGINIALRLDARWSHAGGTRLVIAQCDVTVNGVFRFKTNGATGTWAYNAMAVLFKPFVVNYIKESVGDAVVRALAEHLRQLDVVSQLDQPPTNGDVPARPSAPPVREPSTTHPPLSATD